MFDTLSRVVNHCLKCQMHNPPLPLRTRRDIEKNKKKSSFCRLYLRLGALNSSELIENQISYNLRFKFCN